MIHKTISLIIFIIFIIIITIIIIIFSFFVRSTNYDSLLSFYSAWRCMSVNTFIKSNIQCVISEVVAHLQFVFPSPRFVSLVCIRLVFFPLQLPKNRFCSFSSNGSRFGHQSHQMAHAQLIRLINFQAFQKVLLFFLNKLRLFKLDRAIRS